ncbi:hypothetical protein DVH05_010918 [Phytophthora capsici]|nr:hypothetical protein DVH05_010918 [Phytophthora capsici]
MNFGLVCRAIIAYVDPDAAEAAEHASIASVRVRRRKPRQGDKRLEFSSHSPEHHSLRNDTADLSESGTKLSITKPVLASSLPKPEEDLPPSKVAGSHPEASRAKHNRTDDTMVVEDIEDDQDNYTSDLHNDSKEQTPEVLQTEANGEIEEVDSPAAANQELNEERISMETLPVDSSNGSRPEESLDSHPTDAQMTEPLALDRNLPTERDTLPKEETTHLDGKPNESANNNEEIETALKDPALQSVSPAAASAENIVFLDDDLAENTEPNDALIEELQNRLCDMEKVMSVSCYGSQILDLTVCLML